MKKKLKLLILISCLMTLVNVGIASISFAAEYVPDEDINQGQQIPFQYVKHADANGPYSGTINVPISFSGSETFVGAGAIYEWDFSDPHDETGTLGYGKYPTHTYTVAGEYIVTLTVTNASGGVFKDIAPVYIDQSGNHLVPYGGCHYTAESYEEIEFDGSDSISTGTPIENYSWDFGDGSTGYGETISHSFDEERVYIVTLEVTDRNGNKRYDVLHADIGMSYSDESDCYSNLFVDEELGDFLEYLLDSFDFTTGFFCSLLDAKIYTKYNEVEKLTELEGLFPLPREIDVNNDGDNDIKISSLKFFKSVKTKSLFDGRVWYQFETRLSQIVKLSDDIKPEDDFTICLQLDFSIVSNYLGLDDTLMRIGYHSALGEAMPNSITVTHIIRPYILWRVLGYNYWPEYGLRIEQCSGDSFSLFGMLLNTAGSSKTTFECSFESLGSNIMYQRTKSGGIFEHAAIIKIPSGNEVELSLIRDKNAIITELSSGFTFSGSITRSFRFSEQGIDFSVSGDSDVSLYDFYFDNPDCTITVGGISLGTSGIFDMNLDLFVEKFTLVGGGIGFLLSDLLIDSKNTEFIGEIKGTLNLELASSFNIELSKGQLVLGFDGEISLSSDCKFRVKTEETDENITVGGIFTIDSPGDITFTWIENQFIIDLEAGLNLQIQDLNFEIGNIITNASYIQIETSGSFGIEWDVVNGLVTITGGSGASLGVTDLDFHYLTDAIILNVSVYGTLEIQAGGWITFGADTFEAGFEGSLDLGTGGAFCEFDVNGEKIKVGGNFILEGGEGGISLSWAEDELTLDVIGNPELSVEDFFFEINLESGIDIIAIAENIGIGINGEFNIAWDTANNEITINAGGGVSLSVTNLDLSYVPYLNSKIFGTLEIEAGGWLTFGEDTFKAGFDGYLNLGTGGDYVTFEINGKNIHVGGKFTLMGGSGEISFEWSNGLFSLSVSGNPELSVEDLYFKAKISGLDLQITSYGIYVGANGNISIDWDTSNNQIEISSDLGVEIGVEDFSFNFNSGGLTVQILGSFEIQADGYLNLGPGIVKAGFTGSINLGGVGLLMGDSDSEGSQNSGNTGSVYQGGEIGVESLGDGYCEFIINGESVRVGGLFSLGSGANGEISFLWDGDEYNLDVTSSLTLTVEELYFEVEIQDQNRETNNVKITLDEAIIGANGDLNVDWDAGNNKITLSSIADVSLSITDFNFLYGPIYDPTLEISIVGTLDIQVDGYLTIGEGIFEGGFTGVLDLGTQGEYCEFIVNDNSIKIGGKYTLTSGDGSISFDWDEYSFTLDYTGSPSLSVEDLYFEAGDLKATADYIDIGINGDFSLDVDTVNNEITIESESGVALYIENVNIIYGDILDVKIIGSLDLQANGWLTLGDGTLKAGFSGSLNLGAEVEFEINGDSISVGGLFTLSVGSGEISFLWAYGEFSLSVLGGADLIVDNLYFSAEIEGEELELAIDEIVIGANGDLTLEWFTTYSKIKLSSDAGVTISVYNIEFSYGGSFSVVINGRVDISGNGSVSIGTGSFEASFSGFLMLSPGFNFEVNGESIKLSGKFTMVGGSGDLAISWTEDEFVCSVSGDVGITVENLYFEIEQLKIDSNEIIISINGDLTVTTDQTNKKFEINCDNSAFGFADLIIYIKDDGIWYQIISVNTFYITGGGHLLLKSNSLIELDFSSGGIGSLDLSNLLVTLPGDWNADLSIASANILGNAYIKIQKISESGNIVINSASGSLIGQISTFDAEILLGSNNLEISFDDFSFNGEFSLVLDDDAQFSAGGSLDITNFNANFGGSDLDVDMNLNGDGDIMMTYTSNPKSLEIDVDVDYIWDITLDSQSIGDWETHGDIEGDLVIYAEWQILIYDIGWQSESGSVDVTINDPGIFNLLEISQIDFDITLSLVDIILSPGTISFEWQHDDITREGYFLIDSELNPNQNSLNLATISWGTKSFSVGWPELKAGDLKFEWFIAINMFRLNNGIDDLAPTFTYKDTSQDLEIFGSSGSLPHDFSKTITLLWYEDNGEITGIQMDTDDTYLTELIEVGFKKGSTGRKLAIYGIECSNFYIKKFAGKLEFGGNIYIANHLIYSKLINSDWKDFDVQWNFQNQEKWIKFTKDPTFTFTLKLMYVEILGYEFLATITVGNNEYFEVRWNIGTSGKVYIDTDWEYFATFDIEIWNPTTQNGVEIIIGGLRAQDWSVAWTIWPPEEWNLQFDGSLQILNIDIWVCKNGDWELLPLPF